MAISALTTALLGGSAGLSLGKLLGGSKSKKVKLPPSYWGSMQRLYELGTQPAPAQPVRQIAQLSPLEQTAQQRAYQWLGEGVPETRRVATEQALKYAQEPYDITTLPEYKGILNKVIEEGNIMANRLARGLQMGGMETSTPGRDILGRSITGTQERIASAIAPYLESERQRQFAAIPLLEQLTTGAETTELKKIGLASELGSLARMIEQEGYTAEHEAELNDIAFRYQIQPSILASVLGQSIGTLTGGEPSTFAQASPLIGSLLQSMILSGMGTQEQQNTYNWPSSYTSALANVSGQLGFDPRLLMLMR